MLTKIANQFRRPSGFWGKIVSNMMIKGNRHEYEKILKDFDIQHNDKLLEIGYGPGDGINLIMEKNDKCELYGIDFSELMYKRATERNKKFIDGNKVKLLFGDFIETKIDVNGFDKIFCLNVVYFWNDLSKPFEKIKSLLKENGIFYFYMAKKEDLAKIKFANNDVFNKHSIEQITEALKKAGFKDVDFYFDKGYYIKAKI